MLKQIIVSEDEYENRVALLEDKELTELFSERKDSNYILGHVYKGRVNSVLPGMQVAFVDIGLPRNAFLHISDVHREFNEFGEWSQEEELNSRPKKSRRVGKHSINDLLKKGQEILVQIDKESIGTKGPRVTAYITLPGRYLVLMPTVENIGISRKIENEAERQRLKELVLKLRKDNNGYIVRTAAEGKGETEFAAEMNFLTKQWETISQRAEILSAPALVQDDLGLIFRILRDIFTEDVSEFVIDSKDEYHKVTAFLDSTLPHFKSRVKLYEKREPIFDAYGVEKAIRRALRRKIWLKSGGYIVIEQTEAMVSIDVNTGKYVGKQDPDDTILKTNLEAVKEVTRQIRLRDVGGIIVIDFIDMDNENHRKKVFRELKETLKRDRSRTNILSFTELGLVEMTRQRTKPSLTKTLCQPCPYCNGYGSILSEETITIDLLRAIQKAYYKSEQKNLKVIANDIIAMRLLQEDANNVKKLEDSLNIKLEIAGDIDLHMEEYRIISLKDNREIYLD
ncbi:Rne/Rng family ribonuclease [Candidatus Poribacteria bacterium]|nr:Rne/Rng family ribonuclease [Candidatus Poribacteria bacterium]